MVTYIYIYILIDANSLITFLTAIGLHGMDYVVRPADTNLQCDPMDGRRGILYFLRGLENIFDFKQNLKYLKNLKNL